MVLEQLLDRKIVIRHFPFVFLLSMVYVFIAYLSTQLFFPNQSIATVLLLTIIMVPSLHHLIVIEEKIESKGSSHFWKRHHTLIKCYTGAFLGLLAGFIIIGIMNPSTLEYQTSQLLQGHLRPEVIQNFSLQPYNPSVMGAIALASHNLSYLLIGFILSLFYGAGAAFIIAYNASVFAAFVSQLFQRFAGATTLAAVSLLHLLPESAGYILAAIAGAALSRGIIHEKLRGEKLHNVAQNCFFLLIAGIICIIIAAFIETFATAPIFHSILS
jgi:uncharacterized membrane protein SpoIIM required for sporulation